jgi:hypothetical protein
LEDVIVSLPSIVIDLGYANFMNEKVCTFIEFDLIIFANSLAKAKYCDAAASSVWFIQEIREAAESESLRSTRRMAHATPGCWHGWLESMCYEIFVLSSLTRIA